MLFRSAVNTLSLHDALPICRYDKPAASDRPTAEASEAAVTAAVEQAKEAFEARETGLNEQIESLKQEVGMAIGISYMYSIPLLTRLSADEIAAKQAGGARS